MATPVIVMAATAAFPQAILIVDGNSSFGDTCTSNLMGDPRYDRLSSGFK
jgi:hypothetical protein